MGHRVFHDCRRIHQVIVMGCFVATVLTRRAIALDIFIVLTELLVL